MKTLWLFILEICFDEQTSNYDCKFEIYKNISFLFFEFSFILVLRDDSLTTTPSEESSQLLARTTDRPRWIPVYRHR